MPPLQPKLQVRTMEESINLDMYLKEAGCFLMYCRDLLEPNNSKEYQINTGLFGKALKLHASIIRNLGDSMTLTILRRVLLETCFTLEYLIKAGDHEAYSAFMQSDAMRQRSLLEFTEASRPELEPLRSAIIAMIKQGYKRDGIKRKAIRNKPRFPKSWYPDKSIADIARALGELGEKWYVSSYAHDSQTIHQSWQDIVAHHLQQDPNTSYLIPNPNTPETTPTQVEEIVCWIFRTVYDYISVYAPNEHEKLNAIRYMHHQLHEPITRIHRELQNT